jgi:crotonobetainyl-CoA:carnitine CoA-transferase CaiB-like acyl-CoA transferase
MDQLRATDSVVDWIDHKGLPFKTMNVIVSMSDSPGSLRIPPPYLGGHTQETLTDLGKSNVEIEALRAAGAIG